MAPRRSRKVRGQGLRVDNNPAGAQADGGHHHHSQTKTQSIVGVMEMINLDTTNRLDCVWQYFLLLYTRSGGDHVSRPHLTMISKYVFVP